MKTTLHRLTFLGVIVLSSLAACSGGNVNISAEGPEISITPGPPASSSETITTHGEITALNDVTINGVRYSATGATVTINGEPGTLSDLARGMVVTLNGTINADHLTGTASSIRYDANLIGPVESLDAATNRLIVMGQTVLTDADTVFAAGIDPTTLAGLSVGSTVEIAGFTNAAGAIEATRIAFPASNAELQIIGKVSSLDIANLLFAIDRLTLDYSGTIVLDLPGGAPANGMMIEAVGSMSNGLFIIERLIAAPQPSGSTGQLVQSAGLITRFNSPSDFDINGLGVTIATATVYVNGIAGDLGLNVSLLIEGDFAPGGAIAADRITFGDRISDVVTLSYSFRDFTEISVPTVFNVMASQGPDFSVEVIVDESAASRVSVTQTGARLNIALAQGNDRIRTLEAIVTMPVLDKIELSGVANATLSNFNQSHMTVNVGGVSRVYGNGLSIDNLTANVSGVSQLGFGDIRPIANAHVDISGVSQATLNMGVGSTLSGSVSTGQGTGVSTLFYYGTNVSLNVTTTFPSTIIKLGETRP